MQGIASNMYARTRSMSCSAISNLISNPQSSGTSGIASSASATPANASNTNLWRRNSVRSLHGCVLHPRAPKIRHLNASHTLLFDLDSHIKKVQELEDKVIEMELELQRREADKAKSVAVAAEQAKLRAREDNMAATKRTHVAAVSVSPEEALAFQQRLKEARQKAEALAAKTNEKEAEILSCRSYHAGRLKAALDHLTKPDQSQEIKLLPTPTQIDCEKNMVLLFIESLVDLVNTDQTSSNMPNNECDNREAGLSQSNSNQPFFKVHSLRKLLIEREKVRLSLDEARRRLSNSEDYLSECIFELENVRSSRRTFCVSFPLGGGGRRQLYDHPEDERNWERAQPQLSVTASSISLVETGFATLRRNRGSAARGFARTPTAVNNTDLLYVFGPNPIFGGHLAAMDNQQGSVNELINPGVRAQHHQLMVIANTLHKFDLAESLAAANLAAAKRLVGGYRADVNGLEARLESARRQIDDQVRASADSRQQNDNNNNANISYNDFNNNNNGTSSSSEAVPPAGRLESQQNANINPVIVNSG